MGAAPISAMTVSPVKIREKATRLQPQPQTRWVVLNEFGAMLTDVNAIVNRIEGRLIAI
jgi:hypothetical protein